MIVPFAPMVISPETVNVLLIERVLTFELFPMVMDFAVDVAVTDG